MVIDSKIVEMAVLGFVGNWFFITRYEGKCYITNIENNGLLLNSREKINEISVWDYDQYITSLVSGNSPVRIMRLFNMH
jgi:hypothetical protein